VTLPRKMMPEMKMVHFAASLYYFRFSCVVVKHSGGGGE